MRVLILAAIPLLAAHAQDAIESNKAQARFYLEQGWFQGKPELVQGLVAAQVRVHDPSGDESVRAKSPARHLESLASWCMINGDCTESEILFQIAEGDKVLTYWIFRHVPKRLLGGVVQRVFGRVPTERRMATVFRFDRGQIVEIWGLRDDLGLYSDLGMLNLSMLLVFALGGAFGMFLMWMLWRTARKRVEAR